MAKSVRQQLADVKEKIEKLQAEQTVLEGKLSNEVDPAQVVPGAVIEFPYGKGENKRTVVGQVVGRKDAEAGSKGGDLVKVAVGEGFEAFFATIYPNQVTKIVQAVEPAAQAT